MTRRDSSSVDLMDVLQIIELQTETIKQQGDSIRLLMEAVRDLSDIVKRDSGLYE